MGTRFDVEVARHFHPRAFRRAWLDEGQALNRALAGDTVAAMQGIVDHVRAHGEEADEELVARLGTQLRATEARIDEGARELARSIQAVVGGVPLTEIGDRVATPLQTAREAAR
jgi:hypothetical protein